MVQTSNNLVKLLSELDIPNQPSEPQTAFLALISLIIYSLQPTSAFGALKPSQALSIP